MGNFGSVDISDLRKLNKVLEELEQRELEEIIESFAKKVAAMLITLITQKTQVVTGDLRRGWTGGTDTSPQTYANSLEVKREGESFVITIQNDMKYASYVESGHSQQVGRYVPKLGKRLKKPWVDGQFMCKISIDEVEGVIPSLLESHVARILKDEFNKI